MDSRETTESCALSTVKPAATSGGRIFAAVQAQFDLQAGRLPLWAAVAMALGCATYLELPFEPSTRLLAINFLILAASLIWVRQRQQRWVSWAHPVLILVLMFSLGLLASSLRTRLVATPILPEDAGARRVEAFVVDIASPGATGPRVLLAPVSISGLWPENVPKRIRVSVQSLDMLEPGSQVSLVGILSPPPGPASPGTYDFARDAFFKSIGGVGFVRGRPTMVALPKPPWRLRIEMGLNRFRWGLTRQIVSRLGPGTGGLAAAMTTGHEAWISRDQVETMRTAGLSHILSISGLHMAIVGGFVFALARILIAAVPPLALRVPGKKWAASAGIVSTLIYLGLSGAPSPAIRSAITLIVAFVAILMDRRAIALRSLASAAVFILLLEPDAAGTPGFQMSFAATAALVALVEVRKAPLQTLSLPWVIRSIQVSWDWLRASLFVSLIASLATAPFAVYHFNRISTYGLVANLIVAPISSFMIMPALAIGALLTSLGLQDPALPFAGLGLELMVKVAAWVSRFPNADMIMASPPPAALCVSFLGIMWLCLWKGIGRWIGIFFALAIVLWPSIQKPSVWIASEGANMALNLEGKAVSLRGEVQAFALKIWARHRGLELASGKTPPGYECNARHCHALSGAPQALSIWWMNRDPSEAEWTDLCAYASLVVVRSPGRNLPVSCDGVAILDGRMMKDRGSAELYRRGNGWAVSWSRPPHRNRPWSSMH